MRYLPQELFVANTDKAWFDFLAADLLEDARDEGWIYSPAPEWIARAASTRRARPRRR